MADYNVQGTNSSVWMPVFVQDGFADDDGLLRFFSKLSEITIDASSTDKVRWKLNTKGCFTMRSFYLKLRSLSQSALVISADRAFPHHLIWRTSAPVKVAFFVWEASHGKILTIDNLQ